MTLFTMGQMAGPHRDRGTEPSRHPFPLHDIRVRPGVDSGGGTPPAPSVPTVTTQPVDSITMTNGMGHGTVVSENGASITTLGLCWSTVSGSETAAGNHVSSSGTIGAFALAITGLSASTTYYVKAYATNAVGTGYGTEVSFLSAATPAVAPTVTTQAASSVLATTATGHGTVTSDGGSTITERGVCWGASSNPTTSGSHATASGTTGAYAPSITGLSPVTTYHIRAYATNAAGTSYGADVTILTLTAFAAAVGADIINGLTSAQSESGGWNAQVKAALLADLSCVARTSDTVATITLPAVPSEAITAQETITATVPASAVAGGSAIVATPTFTVDVGGGGGGGAGTIVFQDSFASGDFSHVQNGVSWSSAVYLDVTTDVKHTGAQCARFREGDSGTWTELRFDGLANLSEVFFEYYLYLPSGSESPSLGPKLKILGGLNDKFFRLWGGGDSGYTASPYSNKVGASTWGDGSGTDGNLGIEYCYSDAGTQWGMGQGPWNAPVPNPTVPFVVDANRGRWIQVRIRAKHASAANNDGIVQLWIDGKLTLDQHALVNGDIYGGTGPKGYTTGYILGWANNGWPAGQVVYLDDFTITIGGFGAP